MRSKYVWSILSALSILLASSAKGEAGGPDYFKVRNLDAGQTLLAREGPADDYRALFELAYDRNALRNLGCWGMGSNAEVQESVSAEQQAATAQVWCKIAVESKEG